MIHVPPIRFLSLLIIACLWGVACQLRRPVTIPGRMIEPQLLEPQKLEPQPESARQRTAPPIPLPSGCSIRRREDISAAECSTSNRMVS